MKGVNDRKMVNYSNKKAGIQRTALATPRYADVLLRLLSSFSICLEDV